MSEELKSLEIDRSQFEMNFEMSQEFNIEVYLDKETGDLIWVDGNRNITFDRVLNLAPEAETFEEVEAAINADESLSESVKKELIDVARIEFTQDVNRYALLPYQNSDVGYRDMENFIETVEDKFLYKLLSVAISGPGAFRRFKDVLIDYPEAKKEWFAFKDECLEERMLDWLRSEGIEPIFT